MCNGTIVLFSEYEVFEHGRLDRSRTSSMGLSDLVTQLPDLIGQAVEANQWLGYTAIFAAMFLEKLFPPIP